MTKIIASHLSTNLEKPKKYILKKALTKLSLQILTNDIPISYIFIITSKPIKYKLHHYLV